MAEDVAEMVQQLKRDGEIYGAIQRRGGFRWFGRSG